MIACRIIARNIPFSRGGESFWMLMRSWMSWSQLTCLSAPTLHGGQDSRTRKRNGLGDSGQCQADLIVTINVTHLRQGARRFGIRAMQPLEAFLILEGLRP
jgi:hypothetical protein